MADVNANINVTVNTSQAVAQLRKLTSEINRFNQQSFAANSAAAQQQRTFNQSLVDGVRTSGHFRTSIVPVISAVDQFSNSIEKGRLSLGQYTRYAASQLPGMRRVFTREFDMISRVAEDRVRRLNTQFVSLGESANGMQRALAMTPTALNQFSAQSAIALQRQQVFNKLLRDGSTQLLNWGKNTQWAGRQLMVGFSIPLALLGAQAAKVFKELEAQALSFKKVYGDIFTTDVEREENLAAIKELSVEMTKYGQSAKQTMEIANTAAAAGAKGAELLAATTQATRLAVLGQMEQNQAIEATISLQTAFAMSNEELAQSINFLNMVENQTILSLDDITEAIPRVASVIKGFGGTVEDLSVLLVAMKEGGVSAAEGANALKNSMARVISPTRNALDVSAKYGIALQDIVRRNEGKVVPLFQELARALEALGGQPRQEVLSAIFGKYQYARIGTLLSNITKEGSQAATAIGLTAMETRDLAAAAERELSVVEESISTKFTAAVEKAKIALAPVGAEFLKALTPVLEVIGKLLSSFNDLPGGIKTAIVAATGIIGGLAPVLLMVIGLLGNGIANIAKFVLFLRKQMATLRGNGEQFKFYTSAELDAAAAAASLEGRTSSLTKTMLLQKPVIESLIGLYTRLAGSAAAVTAAMPTTMGMPAARGAAGAKGFAAVAPPLPAVYKRNAGGPIFESRGGKTIVPGVGNTDTVPAMLTPGEFVINKEATRKNLPLIEAINSGGVGLRSKSSGIPVTGQGVQSFLLGSQVAKIVGAHASTQMALRGKNRLAFLGGAERALVKANRNAVVLGLDRSMLNIDDRYNQLMKSGGRGVNDVTGFAKHIKSRKDLFDKMPEIAGLPSSVKNEFRTLIANKISTTKPPITDAKFAKAYNSAISEMRKNLKGNKSNLSLFDEAVAATRQLSQTRVLFKPPRGTNVPRLNGANEAKSAMKNFGFSDSVKNGNPFYYVDTKSGKTSAIVWNEDTGRYVSVTTDSTRKVAKSRMPKPVQRKNKGGMIAGTQYLMSGRMVQPYVRPKKPAGPRATELEKALMQKRANAKVASGKQLDDLIFRRDKNGKLDLDSTELLTMLSSNPNITDRQLSQISKYHGSRIRTGMFGRFDKDAGIRFRDSDWGAWKDISKIMQERGFPIVQSRNKGGMIPGVQYFNSAMAQRVVQSAATPRALGDVMPSMANLTKMRRSTLGMLSSDELIQLNTLISQGRYSDAVEALQLKQIGYKASNNNKDLIIVHNGKALNLGTLLPPTGPPAGRISGLPTFSKTGSLSSNELVELNRLMQQGRYDDVREILTTRGIPFRSYTDKEINIIHDGKLVNLSNIGKNKGGAIRKYGFGGFINKMFKANKGRMVPGLGSKDTVPAMLTPGEFVVNKKSTQENLPLLHAINDGNIQRLQNGAQVQEATQTRRTRRKRQRAGRGRLPGETRLAFREEIARSVPPTESRYTEERFRRAELARAERAARTGFQVQREHVESKTRFGGGSTRWGTGPENQLSNILKNSERTRNEYLKRLDSYFEEEKRRVQASDRRQKQKDRMQSNLDKQRDRMIEKVNNNFALNARERQIQSRVLTTMVKDVKSGKLTSGRAGQVSANFSRIAGQVIEAAKSYMAPSRPGLPGAVPLGEPIKPPTPMKTPKATLSREERKREKGIAKTRERVQSMRGNPLLSTAQEIRKANPGMSLEEAKRQAKAQLGMPVEEKPPTRMQRINQRIGSAGMGLGMALSMASMAPMMMKDEQGKFMGMDANAAMFAMMGGGTLLSLAPMMGAAAAPVVGLAAIAAAVGVSLNIWRKSVDETAKKTATLGANTGGAANALNTMANLFGEKTPAQRRTQMQLGFTQTEQEQSFGEFQNYLGTDVGAKFIKDLENATSAERFTKLSSYLANAIAAGILDENKAKLFAKTVATSLNDSVLGSSVIKAIENQKVGAEGILELAEKRLQAAERSLSVRKLESETTVEESDASFVIGAGIQIIQDFSNAAALAKEEYIAGTRTFDEYREVVNRSKVVQEEYTKAMQDAFKKTEDFGATMQAAKDQFILSGGTPEAQAAFERAATRTRDVTPLPAAGALAAPALALQERYLAGFQQLTSGQASFGNVINSIVTGTVQEVNAELYAAMFAASKTGKYSDADIAAIAENIVAEPQGRLAKLFEEYGKGERALGRIMFEESMKGVKIPGLDAEGQKLYTELAFQFDESSGEYVDYVTFINNIPEELRIPVLIDFKGLTSEGQAKAVADQAKLAGMFGMDLANQIQQSLQYQFNVEDFGLREVDESLNKELDKTYKNLGDLSSETIKFALSLETAINPLSDILARINATVEFINKNIPKEIQIGLGIDIFNPQQMTDLENAQQQLLGLSEIFKVMKPEEQEIAARIAISVVDDKNQPLTGQELITKTADILKAVKNLDSKDLKKEKEATLTVVQSFKNQDGEMITPEDALRYTEGWLKQFGQKKFSALNEVDIQTLVNLDTQLEGAEKALAALKASRIMQQIKGANTTTIDTQIADLEQQIKSFGLAKEMVGTGAGRGTTSGGGGGAESPLKGFVQGIVDQAKIWSDATAKISDLNNLKGAFANAVLKGQGLFDKLRNVKGISPTQLQEILGMGPEGVTDFIKKYVTKAGQLTKQGAALLRTQLRTGAAQTTGENIITSRISGMQVGAARVARTAGANKETIESIAGDPVKAAKLMQLQKDVKNNVEGAKKAKRDFIKEEQNAIEAAKLLQKELNPGQFEIEQIGKEFEKMMAPARAIEAEFKKAFGDIERSFQPRIKASEKIIKGLQEQIDLINKEISALEKLNNSDQNRIRGLERQKEIINRQIEALDRQNELDERRIETLSRQDDIRNREAESLNQELDAMSQLEEKIRESYQKRIDALDKVAQLNDHISDQQRQQVGLSQAISEGDIYAATAAAQEMRASQAQFAQQQVRAGLEQGMESAVAGLRTSGGLTREQAEAQINQIKEQSYQTSLLIRDIEDRIYERNQQMIPLKDQQRSLDDQIRVIQDAIYDRESQIIDIQSKRIEPLQTALDKENEKLTSLQNQVEAEKENVRVKGLTYDEITNQIGAQEDLYNWAVEQIKANEDNAKTVAAIGENWRRVAAQINEVNKAATNATKQAALTFEAEIVKINRDKTKGLVSGEEAAKRAETAATQREKNIAEAEIERLEKVNKLRLGALEDQQRLYQANEESRNTIAEDTRSIFFTPSSTSKREREKQKPIAGGRPWLGKVAKKFAGGMINYKGSNESPPPQRMMGGGKIKKYPMGGLIPYADGGKVFGRGGMDSVNALLTPGEFVVRRAMVDKYGIPMLNALNQGAFGMPRYNVGQQQTGSVTVKSQNTSNIVAPMYNNYSVNVSVSNTNASADEIANRTLMKIKQMQDTQIRSGRGY